MITLRPFFFFAFFFFGRKRHRAHEAGRPAGGEQLLRVGTPARGADAHARGFFLTHSSWWLLPGQELPGELRNCDAAVWEREMRELESRQPQQTPLDDDHDRW